VQAQTRRDAAASYTDMKHGCLVMLAVACLWPSTGAARTAQRAESAQAAFERLAAAIVVLGPEQFVWGLSGESRFLPERLTAPVRELRDLLAARRWTAGDFRPLLAHADAKVRTLALVALYDLEDPHLLPDIVRLVNDEAPTFPAVVPTAAPFPPDPTLEPRRLSPQTVRDIAEQIVKVYLRSGGYGERVDEFADYWKAHANRTWSAGWFGVRLARASASAFPTQDSTRAAIGQLRTVIDRLADPDRTHVLLWLHGEAGADVLAPEGELVALARQLGPDSVMDILRRRIRSDDPDLQARDQSWPYSRLRLFILQHAGTLLRASDVQALLDQEAWERDFQAHGITSPLITPWWAIAAAELSPTNAPTLLTLAYARFQGEFDASQRLEVAHAWWRVIGPVRVATAVDWFYREVAMPQRGSPAISYMLDRMLRTGGRDNALLARAIIRDQRLEGLNLHSLDVLARAVNRWAGREIVSERELDDTDSPAGIDFFFALDLPSQPAEWSRDLDDFLAVLRRWRDALRAYAQ
jgi:hypothetical protein